MLIKESIYLFFAIIPAILWIYYFYTHDKKKEPLGLLIFSALLGSIAVIPALFLEWLVIKNIIPFFFSNAQTTLTDPYGYLTGFLIINIVIVSLVEEVLKFLPVKLVIYKLKYFNEISDGIIYMVATAFGFAAFENFLYFLNFGQEIIFIRSLFTPLFHASASAIIGYYLVLVKKNKAPKEKLFLAFAFSIALHSVYNFLAFFSGFSGNSFYMILTVLLLAFSGKWMLDKFKKAEDLDNRTS